MRRSVRGISAALLCLTVAGAWRPLGDPLKLAAESRVWFDGTSTVRSWSCKATQIDAVIDADAGAVANVLKGQKAVKTVTLTFPTAKLDCANGTMNGHMMKALNGTANPNITFALSGYDLSAATLVKGTLNGALTINGVTKPISMPAEFSAAAAGALHVVGKYSLTMTEWQVVPPKLMMGAMKVGPVIVVNFDLLLNN
ncbi:MAG: YceI family protein [Gemmatimonadetes bacterium]|nr:YceI family protein [Gemmatimonadota bacterium]